MAHLNANPAVAVINYQHAFVRILPLAPTMLYIHLVHTYQCPLHSCWVFSYPQYVLGRFGHVGLRQLIQFWMTKVCVAEISQFS